MAIQFLARLNTLEIRARVSLAGRIEVTEDGATGPRARAIRSKSEKVSPERRLFDLGPTVSMFPSLVTENGHVGKFSIVHQTR